MIKTPIPEDEEIQSFNPEIKLDKNFVKVSIENKKNILTKEASDDNQGYRYALEQLYKLHSINSSKELLLMGNEYRPISSTYAVRSHIPVMHNVVLEFKDDKKVGKCLIFIQPTNELSLNKYNALKETRHSVKPTDKQNTKLIIWDKATKQWVASEKPTENAKNELRDKFSKTMIEFTEHINAPAPLHKIDSASSDDAYNVYKSYYKRIPQSQGGDRDIINSKLNEDLRENDEENEESMPKDKYYPQSEVMSQPHIESISQHSLVANEYLLYQMVNRVNVMPLVDNRAYIGKSTKAGHRILKKFHTKHHFEQPHFYSTQNNDQSIRVESKIASINSKLRNFLK